LAAGGTDRSSFWSEATVPRRRAPTPDSPVLAAALAAIEAAAAAGSGVARVEVLAADGTKVELVVTPPGHEPAKSPTPIPPERLLQLEAAIVEALAGGVTLTGEEIARKANYAYSGRFKEALARLVRDGRIKNHRPGYSL
jgi:hypothetical protein